MESRIFIFRHGETDWNREHRFQGHLDIPLNETGRAQARALIPRLREAGIEAILSSDLCRAYETARIAANRLGVPIFVNAGLREADIGQAQGLRREEIEERFGPGLISRWRSSDPSDADICFPGGESGTAIMNRVFNAIEGYLRSTNVKAIGVSAHGGVIRRMMQKILPEGSEEVSIPNGVLYELRWNESEDRWWVP